MRHGILEVALFVTGLSIACDSGSQDEAGVDLPAKSRSLGDLKQSTPPPSMTEEERAAKLRAAGITPQDELEREAKAEYERSERLYIKERMPKYDKLLKEFTQLVAEFEQAAAKIAKSKKPDAEIEKFKEKYGKKTGPFFDQYNELTDQRSRGGDTQVDLDKAVRRWQELKDELSAEMAAGEELKAAIAEIREQVSAVEKQLQEIKSDASLKEDAAAQAADGKAAKTE
jgi:chromosome segregation ATPase